MSETLKSTIVGTIIIGIFMLIAAKMVTTTATSLAVKARNYIEVQKREFKPVVKREKRKAKDVILQAAEMSGE